MFLLHLALVLLLSVKVLCILCLPIRYQVYGIYFPPILYSTSYLERVNFYLHACKCVCLGGDMHMSIGALGPKDEIRFIGARVTGDSELLDPSAGR